MRIALITRKLSNRGGAQRQFLSLALELQKIGHAVMVYALSCERKKSFPEILDQLALLTLPPSGLRSSGGRFGFLAEDRMAVELASLIDPATEILNPHDAPAHHVAYYFKNYVRNIPSVWNVNELPFMRWPPEWELDVDPAMHDVAPGRAVLVRLRYRIKNRYDRRFVRAQDAIVTIDGAHREAIRFYLGRESSIAHSGVDLQRFRFVSRTPPAGAGLCLLSSGILMHYRRFEDVIQAAKLLADAGYEPKLTIVGEYRTDATYHRALQNLGRDLGFADRVIFTGKVTDEELDRLLVTHDLFVYPHLQSQAIAIYEAMATGLPVIAAQVPGAYDTLTNGFHALLVPPKDPAALAGAVRSLIGNPDLYLRLSRQGAELIRSRFSWANYAREMMAVFERAVSAHPRAGS